MSTKKKKKTTKKTQNEFGSAFLADSINLGPNIQLDAKGVISVFWVWSFPSIRKADVFFSIFDVSAGSQKFAISYRRKRTRKSIQICKLLLKTDGPGEVAPVIASLNFVFTEPGAYVLTGQLAPQRKSKSIPFLVLQKPWPVYTKREKRAIAAEPTIATRLRVNVQCGTCKASYTFVDTPDQKTKVPHNIYRFPDSDFFDCENCKAKIPLKDIQGQVRDSIKESIKASPHK